ncbi:MAG: alpha-glucosidase, partial [Lactobacillus sp.]|nr:alpha-glucosidase [Lactobacillus sp.]
YDISDYEVIMEEFGTMSEMEKLISEANKRSIKIIMDLVVNHTSDEHKWFIEAKKSKSNPYRDFYIWADPAENGGVPNELTSNFSSAAWEYDKESRQYYLHLFGKKQPDLNWENKEMREKIHAMMNHWVDKGIGGFRMDVIDLIGKVPAKGITADGPKLHGFLQEINQAISSGDKDLLMVGETWSATPETAKLYSSPSRNELSMVFQFEHISLDEQPSGDKWDLRPLKIRELKEVFNKWQTELNNEGWNSLFWNNHDLPRIVSRWGDDAKNRNKSAKMLAILLHMMKGTPYIFQGEEIGMTNTPIKDIIEAEDIETINMYYDRLSNNYDKEDILHSINVKGRDNSRRPMQWDDSKNSGFTTGTPWIALNENFKTINVKEALADSNSIFFTYQKLIRLRKVNPIMVWGDFKLIDTVDNVFSYYRTYQGQRWLIVTNFSDQTLPFSSPEIIERKIIQNEQSELNSLKDLLLSPWQAFVVEVKS